MLDDEPEPSTDEPAGPPGDGSAPSLHHDPRPEPEPDDPIAPEARRVRIDWRSPRMMALSAVGLILVGIIVVDAVFIGRAVTARATAAGFLATPVLSVSATANAAAPSASPDGQEVAGADPGDAGEASDDSAPEEPPGDRRPDESPGPARSKKPPLAQSVEQAFSRGCSTASVDGLSRQIVAEARCLDANAFASVPARKNLVTQGHVFLHLEAPARDQLLHVLDAHPERKMTVNSAFRTVVQQYLLDRWARTRKCGIKLAARPGESNHETGLALDVSEPDLWRAALEKQGFRWLGPTDRVHFDYQGPGASRHEGLDIQAFQRLWNRNHPEDRIAENGAYNEQTEARIKKSPASGFAQGPSCARSSSRAARPGSKTR